jgi:16S rRNA (uracil1498-N3)-methyltransferase
MRRLQLAPSVVREGVAVVGGAEAHYLRDVLRLRAGDSLMIFDGAGREAEARVLEVGRIEVRLGIGEPRVVPPPALRLSLVVGLAKGEKLDLVVEKACELGVAAIYPAATERAVVQLSADRAESRIARWRRVAAAAARQCGRADVPRIEPVRPWREQLAQAPGEVRLCFYEGSEPGSGRQGLARARPGEAAVAVGPEGGLTEGEVEAARALGWSLVSMGPRTLRAETAAIVALALAQAAWGDLG